MNWIESLLPQSENSWSKTHDDLQELLLKNNIIPKLGVEIGVAFGSNSYKLLEKNENLYLYSLDPYKKYSETDLMSSNVEGTKGDQLFEYVSDRLRVFGTRSKLIRTDSDFLTQNFEDNTLDFVFIDGDHSYDGVRKDLQNSYSKVKSGGMILGDDYGLISDVSSAVNDFFSSLNLEYKVQNLVWWVIKP